MSQNRPAPSAAPADKRADKSADEPRAVKRESTLELAATLFTREQLKAALADMGDAPQIALAGRSNVGKSSLLNALARRKQLAKVSSTPGKTRSVNLFRAAPEGFYVTDLPGYGYARRGKAERRAWGELIGDYLTATPQLKAVAILLDCRLPPQQADRDMVSFARAHGLPVLAVLTKADKCNQRERETRRREWAVFLRGEAPLPVSSKTGMGMVKLWELLRAAAGMDVMSSGAEDASLEAQAAASSAPELDTRPVLSEDASHA